MAAKGSAAASVRRTYDLAAEAHHAKLLDPSDSAWNVSERYAILESLGDLSGKSILDVGCGSGIATAGLFGRGAASITGVDFSRGQIAIAARENPAARFAVGDAAALPLPDGAFDLAVGSYLIHYFSPQTPCPALRGSRAGPRTRGQVPFLHGPSGVR